MSVDAFDRAVACGLTKRFGPSEVEVRAMSVSRRLVVACLPRNQRWRLSALAEEIRSFERGVGGSR